MMSWQRTIDSIRKSIAKRIFASFHVKVRREHPRRTLINRIECKVSSNPKPGTLDNKVKNQIDFQRALMEQKFAAIVSEKIVSSKVELYTCE